MSQVMSCEGPSFRATGPKGDGVTIEVSTTYAVLDPPDGRAVVPLTYRLRSLDGREFRRLDRGTYQDPATGAIYTSNDPDAP